MSLPHDTSLQMKDVQRAEHLERMEQGGPQPLLAAGSPAKTQAGALPAKVQALPEKRPMTPEEKRSEMKFGCDGSTYDACEYKEDLEAQLMGSRRWSGELLRDTCFWIFNWHPFFGMFLSHPLHPWGKVDRIFAFAVALPFNLLMTAIYVKREAEMDEEVGLGFALFLTATLPTMLFETIYYHLAISHIYFRGGWCSCLSPCISCLQGCKFCCAGGMAIYVIAMVAGSLGMLTRRELMEIGVPFVTSRGWGYLTWFPLWFLFPCIGFLHKWYKEGKAVKAGAQGSSRTS